MWRCDNLEQGRNNLFILFWVGFEFKRRKRQVVPTGQGGTKKIHPAYTNGSFHKKGKPGRLAKKKIISACIKNFPRHPLT